MDAGQGEDGGLGLSAELRRGDLQGRGRDLRRLGLRHRLRRCGGGLDIKGTEALCHADSEDEAIEIIAALTQLYREQGRYLERMYKWLKRVGMDSIQAAIVKDREKRRMYYDRFVYSQSFAQVDPWEERVNGKDAHEFAADGRVRRAAGGGVNAMLMNDWVEIGRIEQIPVRGARCVNTPAGKIAVFRTAENQVYAIENRCPHKGGPLSEGIVHGGSVTCPLHNWVFDLATGEAQGADEGQVRTFAVNVIDGRIFMAAEVSC